MQWYNTCSLQCKFAASTWLIVLIIRLTTALIISMRNFDIVVPRYNYVEVPHTDYQRGIVDNQYYGGVSRQICCELHHTVDSFDARRLLSIGSVEHYCGTSSIMSVKFAIQDSVFSEMESQRGRVMCCTTLVIGITREQMSRKVQILKCGPMPNVMVAQPNTGGALCSTPQSLADAHY